MGLVDAFFGGLGDKIGISDVFGGGTKPDTMLKARDVASSMTAPANYYLGGYREYGTQRGQGAWQAGMDRGGRAAPTVNQSAYQPYLGAGSGQLGSSNAALMQGAQQMQGSNLAGLGQMNMANYMQNVAMGTAGPSAAELAMQRASAGQARQNMMMAAAAGGGPGAVAAQMQAQNANQLAQGQLVQDLGVQRAQEQIQARDTYARTLADARAGYATGAGAYGALAGQSTDVAGQFGQYAGLEADIAKTNAANQLQQTATNDAALLNLSRLGFDWEQAGQAGTAAYNDALIRAYGAGTGAATAQQQLEQQQLGSELLMLGTGIGAASDVRAKTDIEPAGARVNETFRSMNPYSYLYRQPERFGAGRQTGIMAQDLESTPAGATAVTQAPDGTKMIDTNRLATLTAAQTAQLRQELDQLQGRSPDVRQGTGALVRDDTDGELERLRKQNDRDAALISALGRREDESVQGLSYPTPYPTLSASSFGLSNPLGEGLSIGADLKRRSAPGYNPRLGY